MQYVCLKLKLSCEEVFFSSVHSNVSSLLQGFCWNVTSIIYFLNNFVLSLWLTLQHFQFLRRYRIQWNDDCGQWIWKDLEGSSQSRHYFGICLERLRKLAKPFKDNVVTTEFRSGNLPNTIVEHFCSLITSYAADSGQYCHYIPLQIFLLHFHRTGLVKKVTCIHRVKKIPALYWTQNRGRRRFLSLTFSTYVFQVASSLQILRSKLSMLLSSMNVMCPTYISLFLIFNKM
jgi:hypothetical protein